MRSVRGCSSLTKRECEVARMVSSGGSNKEIGGTLGITEGSVKQIVHAIFLKLRFKNRTELAVWAVGALGGVGEGKR